MKDKFHGVFSLILIFAAVGLALVYMLNLSAVLGAAYLAIIIVAVPVVLYSYCAKCSCREGACSHVLPGRLIRLLPARRPGPYSLPDYLATALALIALLGFPQIWLWHNKIVFVVFWVILLAALAEILFLVCRTCNNQNCPINPSTSRL